MKKLVFLVLGLALAVQASALSWSANPGSAASGQGYSVAASEYRYHCDVDLYVYKNGALVASGSGYQSVSASASSTDYGAQVVAYHADAYAISRYMNGAGEYDEFYSSIDTSVTITAPPNNPPTIDWVQNPASAAVNQWFAIQAHGHDSDGNLTQVFVWREWTPFAFNGGGNGYDGYSDANGYAQASPGTVTFMAQATDSNGAVSGVITHTVTITQPNRAPTVSSSASSIYCGQTSTVSWNASDADNNLSFVDVYVTQWGSPYWDFIGRYASASGSTTWSSSAHFSSAIPAASSYLFVVRAVDAPGAYTDSYATFAITNRQPNGATISGAGSTVVLGSNGQYTMWLQGVPDNSNLGQITLTAALHDDDGNLAHHRIYYQRVTGANPDPNGWIPLTGYTPSNATNSTISGTFTPSQTGRWDFHTDGDDNYASAVGGGASITVYVYGNTNNSTFVSETVNGIANPSGSLTVNNGTTFPVTITMRNSGDRPWTTDASPHQLKALFNYWGAPAVALPAATPVIKPAPQSPSDAVFTFNVTAPTSPGPYQFQWQMVEAFAGTTPPFGAATPALTLTVVDNAAPTVPTWPTTNASSALTATGFTVTWNASTDNDVVTKYEVTLSKTGSADQVFTVNAPATTCTFTGLIDETTYSVKVRAKDNAGTNTNWSAQSAALSVTTPLNPFGDADGDGMANKWESDNGLNPRNASDASLDPDADGLSNVAEFNLGTNPNTFNVGTATTGGSLPAGWPNAGDGTKTAAYAVGATAGSLQVDKSGSAGYSVPLWVTPGTAGMEPKVALNYSSLGGAGIAGFGWSLSGVSGITRGPQTLAVDGAVTGVTLSASDRFYLDGQRLILVSGVYGGDGAEYRTELDSLTKVVSYGMAGSGPAYFKAWTKAGLIIEYGNTSDSARGTSNALPEKMAWMVNRISDTVGNYMKFTYTQDATTGLHVLLKIDYTGNGTSVAPYASVVFTYENRSDWSQGYSNGAVVSNLQRLTKVESFYGGVIARTYTLAYRSNTGTQLFTDRSMLASLTEAGSDGKAYPALTFDYAGESYGWTTNDNYLPPYFLADNSNSGRPAGSGFVDLNGDGLTDFVAYRFGTGGVNTAVLNTGSGWSANNAGYQLPYPLADVSNSNDEGSRLVDVNGDGLVDYIYRKNGSNGAEQQNQAYLNTGSGWANTPAWCVPAPIARDGTQNDDNLRSGKFIDVNGDGRVDFVTHLGLGSATTNLAVYLNNGSGFDSTPHGGYSAMAYNLAKYKARFLDVNGDGLPDIVINYVEGSDVLRRTLLNTGSGWVESTAYLLPQVIADASHPSLGAEFIDVNGDGLPDLVWYREMSNGSKRGVALNTGRGWFTLNVTTAPAYPGEPTEPIDPAAVNLYNRYAPPVPLSRDGSINPGTSVIDLNADGMPDLAINRQFVANGANDKAVHFGNQRAWNYAGAGFAEELPYLLLQGGVNQVGADFVDLNGDGVVDAVWNRKHADSSTFGSAQINQASPLTGRLIKVTNGMGVAASITYASLLDSTVYTKGTTVPTTTAVNITGPMYVVKSVSNDDGVGGQYAVNYSYAGLRSDRLRGSLGFESQTVTDSRTGIVSSTTFSQVYPFIGMPVSSETRTAGNVAISSSAVTYTDLTPIGATHLPFASQSVESSYELNGSLIVTTTTAISSMDTYANVTGMTVSTSDGFSKTTTSQYTNDITNWFLGRLTSATVSSSGSNATEPVSRTSSFSYHPTTGLLLSETVEPNSPTLSVTTTYGYDAFGNKTSVTVSGANIAVDNATGNVTASGSVSRSTTTQYDANGRFPVYTANSLGHQENYTGYDQALGVLTELSGVNGLLTSWSYDGFGRKQLEVRADLTSTATYYRWAGTDSPVGSAYLVETQSTGTAPSLAFYDNFGRARSAVGINGDGKLVWQQTLFDSLGRAYAKSNPYFVGGTVYWTQTTQTTQAPQTTGFDLLNRPLSVQTPDDEHGPQTSTYAYSGFVSFATDPQGRIAVTVKNSQGWTTSNARNHTALTSAPESTVTYSYDAAGNLRYTTAAGVITQLLYDNRGRKTSMIDPDMGTWQYRYDIFGELIWQKDAKGQIVTLAYDSLGRMVTRTETEGTTTWTYDTAAKTGGTWKGKLGSMSAPGGHIETYAYDSLGRPTSVSRTIDGLPYAFSTTYDSVGRPLRTTYPATGIGSGPVSTRNVYNAYGYLKEIRNYLATDDGKPNNQLQGLLYWQAESYSITGKIDGEVYGNGLANDRFYSEATGRLIRASIDRGTVLNAPFAIQQLTYTYDAVGNVLTRTDSAPGFNRSESFGYDGLDRLTSHALTGGATVTTAYAAAGNITAKSDVGAYAYSGVAAGPHAVTTAGPNNYTYDADGNQLTAGPNRSYEWASFNQLRKITDTASGKSSEFTFGAGHERVKQVRKTGTTVTDTTVYVGALYEKVTTTAGTLVEHKHYIMAPTGRIAVVTQSTANGSLQANTTRYFHTDGLGSITAVSDEKGAVLKRYAYDGWGRQSTLFTATGGGVTNTAPTTRGYTDHEMLADFGLIHMNGRVYDPTLGRFLSADPNVDDATDAQGFNRYSYVGNNPMNATDPSGYFSLKDALKIVAIVVAAVVTAGAALAAIAPGAFSLMGGINALFAGGLTFGQAVAAGAGFGFGSGFAGSLLNGGSIGDAFKAGIIGAAIGGISAGIAHGIGTMAKAGDWGWGLKAAAHGAAQGGLTEATGGEFRHGFYAGFFSSVVASSGFIDRMPGGVAGKTVASAVVGGTASAIGGGKFANGAVSGAFTYLFNHAAAHQLSGKSGRHLVVEFDGPDSELPAGSVSVASWEEARAAIAQAPDAYYDSITFSGHGSEGVFTGGAANSEASRDIAAMDFDRYAKTGVWKQDPNALAAFKEVARTLRSGGSFIYASCNTGSGSSGAALVSGTKSFLGGGRNVVAFGHFTQWNNGAIYKVPNTRSWLIQSVFRSKLHDYQ